MAKGTNQKLKLLFLTKIFNELTDEEHGLTMPEIIELLNGYDVNADRKTLYLDFEELRHFGFDIVSEKQGYHTLYRLASREFELAELKLLVDSVQSAKFMTEKKSRELIKKLEALVSTHNARELHRQVIITGRVKTANESIYYSVDQIHSAIGGDSQIRFQYFQWNRDKEPELRHNGEYYRVSPWALVWDDEYYYLIGYDPAAGIMKHYRVDKMLHIELTHERREGKEIFQKMDLPRYSGSLFGMYGGEETFVTLLCENRMAGAIIDRFGKEIPFIPTDSEHFSARVPVAVSDQFLGWVAALGSGVKVTSPPSMVEEMQKLARRLTEQYG